MTIIQPPSKALLASEFPRGALEYVQGIFSSLRLAAECPRGDGGPVMVLPGLGTNDLATSMLRKFLADIGYVAAGWGRGFNTGPGGDFDEFVDDLLRDVDALQLTHKAPVRLIGWSLGGVYAREMAKRAPHLVAQVITLGAPFNGTADSTNAAAVFELLSGCRTHRDPAMLRRLAVPPTVPTISVYSKTDGIVAWESSLNPELPHLENVELSAVSHLGMVSNPLVYRLLAAKLLAPEVKSLPSPVVAVNFRRSRMRRAA